MTTENVAILFTDIVGSTALSQRLSAEGATMCGGRISPFCARPSPTRGRGGEEPRGRGHGRVTSASAALACGVAMQQAVEQHDRRGLDRVGCGSAERRRGGP